MKGCETMSQAAELVFNIKSKKPTATPVEHKMSMSGSVNSGFTFTRKRRKITAEQYKELEQMYQTVVVNDYGDEYHMSEEERKKKFVYYEAFMKVKRCKRKFHKLDEYVRVYRICLECLRVVANNNGVYDPEKFMRMVIRGDIEVFGLHFPKYIGKDKKDINWDFIARLIMDPSRDASEVSKEQHSPLDNMDEEELKARLFDKNELKRIFTTIDNDEYMGMRAYDEETERENPRGIIFVADEKETKKLIKRDPTLLKCVKEMVKEDRKRKQQNGRLRSFAFDLSEDDFDYIASIDQSRGYHSESDIPKFKGDIMKRRDYMRYMKSLDDYEKTQIKVNYKGKMRSEEEIQEIELKDALEAAGWNVRKLYREKDKIKKLKKAYKRDKKREDDLKRRLMEIQDRQKKRKKKSSVEFNSKKKKKKSKKKGDD